MVVNPLIADTALLAAVKAVPLYSEESGFCLRIARQIVMNATGLSYDDFFSLVTEKVEDNQTQWYWSRDLQRSLRRAGCSVPWDERTPGMLLFDATLAQEGHVGALVTRDRVLENTGSGRGVLIEGKNRLSHVNEWREPGLLEVMSLERVL